MAVAALLVPSLAHGQRAEYERRLDSLVAVYQSLTPPSDVATTRRAVTDSVTVHVGPLAIVADRSERALVEAAVPRVDTVFTRVFGSPPPSFHGWMLRLHTDTASGKTVHMISLRDSNGVVRSVSEMEPTAAALGDVIISETGVIAARLSDSTFRTWLGSDWAVDFYGPSKEEWTTAWMDVAGTGNQLVNACVKGDMHACMTGLDLTSDPTPLHGWYTAQERATLVAEWSRGYGHVPPPETGSCLTGSQPACDSVLMNPAGPPVHSPLAGSARRSLTDLALSFGSSGAATRLAHGGGSPQQQLAAVAGIPIDSLVALWRKNVLTNHSAPDITSAGTLLAAFLWAALLAVLALRSSRWR